MGIGDMSGETTAKSGFGPLLAGLRGSIHLTQKQAADLFHTSEDNYAHYEHGRRTPDRDRVIEFLRNFRRKYPAILTEKVAQSLLRAYDPARPVALDEWEIIFGQAARQAGTGTAPGAAPAAARVFLAYQRDAEPDAAIARQIAGALGRNYEVSTIPDGGGRWALQLDAGLRQAGAVVLLLSAQSAQSEMLRAVIGQATELAQAQGTPQIIPVRLAYRGPLPPALRGALGLRAGVFWQDPADTPGLLADLQRLLQAQSGTRGAESETSAAARPSRWPAGEAAPPVGAEAGAGDSPFRPARSILVAPTPAAQPGAAGSDLCPPPPALLEMPEGTMDPQSRFYVQRPSDARAQATIEQQGVTITIKGPRQMGKSSLLYRTVAMASAAGKRVVLLDFQLFDQAALARGDVFLRQFCAWIGDELGLAERIEEYWRLPVSNIQRCTNYLKKYLLPQLDRPLVLAMDEVDRIFDTDYRSDFFGMLRSWHNMRQATVGPDAGAGLLKRLDLVLVTSTEPYQFVANLNQSPFNVGTIIDLEDLTAAQVADLNRRHGSPLRPDEEARLMGLVGGQPYLVRRALYLLAAGQMTAADLFATATADRGPFGDHLRSHLYRLYEKPELAEALRQIVRNGAGPDEQTGFRLRGAGLVKREGTGMVPRYPLYGAYFGEHLRG